MNMPSVAAIALAAALAQPASAITFPSLTTIYVGTGVEDDGGGAGAGWATVFQCTNVSGQSADIRFLVLSSAGAALGSATLTVPHGGTRAAGTHDAFFFTENVLLHAGTANANGGINIESTQSGVFCTANVTDGLGFPDFSYALRLVRVNPHPGTVE
jgi:hypothetical protein